MQHKKAIFQNVMAVVLSIVMVFTLSNGNVWAAETTSNADSTNSYGLVDSVQDGIILHAWNWSYDTIKDQLWEIAEAGYSTVQTSPVQQPKHYNANYTDVSSQWWKLYQPVSFSIASSSWLGTEDDLAELCAAADHYGIKIICDIVANHMAGDSGVLDSEVATYEPTIYNNSSEYIHSYIDSGDHSIEAVVRGCYGGRPDVNTASTYIQTQVINLLKDCIDCGVDGFRWDMAKHIETSTDGDYASNFWSNVIGTAKAYASSTMGIDLYNYGEVLNTVGTGRDISGYTSYMSVTDNQTGDNVTYNVANGYAQYASSNYYYKNIAASKIVLWAESHDTYMGDLGVGGFSNTANVPMNVINQSWAIVASRADASALYFARPGSAIMGQMGTTNWCSDEVAAVNHFHNDYTDAYEYLSYQNSVVMNERYETTDDINGGAVLVNCNGGATSISMTANRLGDGNYIDTITGNTFTVASGVISGTIGDTGIAVVVPAIPDDEPSVTCSLASTSFTTETLDIDLGLLNATSGTYQIDNGSVVSFTGDTTITIGEGVDYGSTITVSLTATDGNKSYSATYTYEKVQPSQTMTIYFTNNYSWSDIAVYYWGSSSSSVSWPGKTMSYVSTNQYNESIYCVEVPSDITGMIINNGGNGCQTVDITSGYSDGLGYYISGTSNGKYTVGTYVYE